MDTSEKISLLLVTPVLLLILISFLLFIVWMVFEAIAAYKNEKNMMTDFYNKSKRRNTLYECRACERLFRKYQWDLVKSKTSKESCPHCNMEQEGNEYVWGLDLYYANKILKPDKWMDSQLDCPKLKLFDYFSLYRNIKGFDRLRKHEEMSKRFEKYNKRDVSNWIEKLQNKENKL